MSATVERDKDTLQTIIERQAAELQDLRAQLRRTRNALKHSDKRRQHAEADLRAMREHRNAHTLPESCVQCGDEVLAFGERVQAGWLCRGCK